MHNRTINRLFVVFLTIHVLSWTLIPAFVRFTLPLDAMEGTTWGHEWAWGYDKNPFLNAWLTEIGIRIGGDWLIYALSTISVGCCFYAIYRVGSRILTPLYALVSVMSLELIQYYTLAATDFNDNVLEIGLWGLMGLFFYQALYDNRTRDWIGLGIASGFALMAKYYSGVLLFLMACMLLARKETRTHFKNPKFYFAAMCFLAVITPHVIWLFHHDFLTIQYVFRRVDSENAWWVHLYYPYEFFVNVMQNALPLIIFLGVLLAGKRPFLQRPRQPIISLDKHYLWFIGAGPLLFTLGLSLITGIRLRAGWGTPLLAYLPFIVLVVLQPRITWPRLWRFIGLLAVTLLVGLGLYTYSQTHAKDSSSANFPAANIASDLNQRWEKSVHHPLRYIVGPRFLAGSIARYSPSRPSVYIDGDKRVSFWINECHLKKAGALFVWHAERGPFPPLLKKRFPRLKMLGVRDYAWLRDDKVSPVKVGVAMLLPDFNKRCTA